MRLPRSAYTSRHWRMHEIAPDFTVEDVWELPIRGDRDERPGSSTQSSARVPR